MVDATTPRSVRGLLAVIAIFSLGVVFGAALSFVIVRQVGRPGLMSRTRDRSMPIARMTRRLDLDSSQQEQVRAILDRGHANMRTVLDATRQEIRAVLRPDQQERFDGMRRPEPPRSSR